MRAARNSELDPPQRGLQLGGAEPDSAQGCGPPPAPATRVRPDRSDHSRNRCVRGRRCRRAEAVATTSPDRDDRNEPTRLPDRSADSYCNRYSAYWHVGTDDCGNSNRDEPWCADFAAWVWRKAGARFVYGFGPDDINAASVSFYRWGVAHHAWHPVRSGYVPQPGDVAVYGLDRRTATAQHVAVVVGYRSGARGPDVINGDGDRTGFSVVENGTDQYKADLTGNGGQLSGYVSLPANGTLPKRTTSP